MYQYDPVTEVKMAHLRQERMDSRLAMLRLVNDAGVVEQSLPIRLIHRIGTYFSHRDAPASGPTSRAA